MGATTAHKRASAPGKVVLSGAYSVLEGAPAIVSAVSRRAIADASLPPAFEPPEVQSAISAGLLPAMPLIDGSALREGDRKLGLGSSAAILVAALATSDRFRIDNDSGNAALFRAALQTHRRAQGGGSGIDIAASTFGGTLRYELVDGRPEYETLRLPTALHFEIWASEQAASTQTFLSRVAAVRERSPSKMATIFRALSSASARAVTACNANDAGLFLSGIGAQYTGFVELGLLASIPICTPEVQALHEVAKREGGLVLPAGAGGGDVAFFAGRSPPSAELRELIVTHGHHKLELQLNAKGVKYL